VNRQATQAGLAQINIFGESGPFLIGGKAIRSY